MFGLSGTTQMSIKKTLGFRETEHNGNRDSYKTFWKVEGEGHICVSSVLDPSMDLDETMIFRCDEDGNISRYTELYTHFGYLSNENQHETVINDWLKVKGLL